MSPPRKCKELLLIVAYNVYTGHIIVVFMSSKIGLSTSRYTACIKGETEREVYACVIDPFSVYSSMLHSFAPSQCALENEAVAVTLQLFIDPQINFGQMTNVTDNVMQQRSLKLR